MAWIMHHPKTSIIAVLLAVAMLVSRNNSVCPNCGYSFNIDTKSMTAGQKAFSLRSCPNCSVQSSIAHYLR